MFLSQNFCADLEEIKTWVFGEVSVQPVKGLHLSPREVLAPTQGNVEVDLVFLTLGKDLCPVILT